MIRAVLFDFDGTIADTYEIVLRGANSVLREMKYKEIVESPTLRDLSIFQVLLHTNIPLWKLPSAHSKVRAAILNDMQRAQLFAGMKEVIATLREHYVVGILTSNSADAVQHLIKKNHIIVDCVHADSSIFGKHVVLQRFLDEQHLEAHEVLYVGDEIRDIEACQKVGVRIIAVTWGYNSKKGLEAAKPHAVATKPAQILTSVKKLDK